eukprot:scaffold5084_cov385-Prasinococcus_capsulatus_cf.AAC.2
MLIAWPPKAASNTSPTSRSNRTRCAASGTGRGHSSSLRRPSSATATTASAPHTSAQGSSIIR